VICGFFLEEFLGAHRLTTMVMAEKLIDGRVIEACQQGDRAAFQLLFETYKDKVFSIAVYSSGGDRAVADDVTQHVFLKLFTAIRQFRGDSEFTTDKEIRITFSHRQKRMLRGEVFRSLLFTPRTWRSRFSSYIWARFSTRGRSQSRNTST
jgi:hypothetical protein